MLAFQHFTHIGIHVLVHCIHIAEGKLIVNYASLFITNFSIYADTLSNMVDLLENLFGLTLFRVITQNTTFPNIF